LGVAPAIQPQDTVAVVLKLEYPSGTAEGPRRRREQGEIEVRGKLHAWVRMSGSCRAF
jgi:hypothetical protein